MLAKLLAANGFDLDLHIVEVGAAPAPGETVPFHPLLDVFSSARITAFDIDARRCDELNRTAPAGMRFHARALGQRDETRPLYETTDPLCGSLYEPDTRYCELFNNLDGQRVARVGEVRTSSLDSFLAEEKLPAPDFLKMDVQGAELEILEGGKEALRSVLGIVSEALFVPMYRRQPLYGEIDAHLRGRGFMLHTFLGFGGRVMKPLARSGMANYPVQMLWTDALFIRDLFAIDSLTPLQLLKLAVMLDVYESRDVALHLLKEYDERSGTSLGQQYLQSVTASPEWTLAS